jgi:hypothetical protein
MLPHSKGSIFLLCAIIPNSRPNAIVNDRPQRMHHAGGVGGLPDIAAHHDPGRVGGDRAMGQLKRGAIGIHPLAAQHQHRHRRAAHHSAGFSTGRTVFETHLLVLINSGIPYYMDTSRLTGESNLG